MRRKQFTTALTTRNLGWSDTITMPVEYCAALAASTALGSDFHRAGALDVSALRRAVLILAKKAIVAGRKKRLPLSREQARKFAISAIFERLNDNCRACTGSGVVIVDELKVICDVCDGHGKHRYRNRERARYCGIPPEKWAQWASRYEMVMSILVANDTAVMLASARLGDFDEYAKKE